MARAKNTGAAAIPQGDAAEREVGEYDGISVQPTTGLVAEFRGIIMHADLAIDAPSVDGEREILCIEGICPANILGAATVTQGTYLKTGSSGYLEHSPTPTRIINLVDLSSESSEITFDNSTYNPKVLILPEDNYYSDTHYFVSVATAFDFAVPVDRAIEIRGLMTAVFGDTGAATAVNVETVGGTEIVAVTIANGSAVGEVDSNFVMASVALSKIAAGGVYRVTSDGAATGVFDLTVRVIYRYQ